MGHNETLSARNLARYGLRRGANRRRFCLFCASMFGTGIEERREYDSKAERDAAALVELGYRKGFRHASGQVEAAYNGNQGVFSKYFQDR